MLEIGTASVDSFLSRMQLELASEVKNRIASLENDITRLGLGLDLARKFKPELAAESEQMIVTLKSQRDDLEKDLAQLIPASSSQITMTVQTPEKTEVPETKPSSPPAPPVKPPSAPPTSPPRDAIDRKSLATELSPKVDDLLKRIHRMVSLSTCDRKAYYAVRSLAADSRCLIARLESCGLSVLSSRLDIVMGELIDWCTAMGDQTGYVYGVSRRCHGTVEAWTELSLGWQALGFAVCTWDDLKKANFQHSSRHQIAALCSRVNLLFNQLCSTHSLDIRDSKQREMAAEIQSAARQNHVNDVSARVDKMTLEDIINQFSSSVFDFSVPVAPPAVVEIKSLADVRPESLDSLRNAMKNPGACELLMLVEKAFAAGIPPSNKELRQILAPARELLPPRTRKGQYSKLVEYLASDANVEAPAMVSPLDPQTKIVPDEVLNLTRGKRMLFLGGHTLVEQQQSLVKAFELDALDWPCTSKDTKLPFLMPYIPRADIVIRLPRWSRKCFKQALDEAHRLGKLTIDVPGGFGINNIAHCIMEQALGNAA